MALPGQQRLFREISVPLQRWEDLISVESLWDDSLWNHFQDGRTMRPVQKAIRAALREQPCTWEAFAEAIRSQKLSKGTRAKIEAWLQRMTGPRA